MQNTQLINQLRELASDYYDRESELLRIYGNVNGDPNGNNTRRIVNYRVAQEILNSAIKELEKK